jgi:quinolinate synthase
MTLLSLLESEGLSQALHLVVEEGELILICYKNMSISVNKSSDLTITVSITGQRNTVFSTETSSVFVIPDAVSAVSYVDSTPDAVSLII